MAAGIAIGLVGVGAAYLFLARPALEAPANAESASVAASAPATVAAAPVIPIPAASAPSATPPLASAALPPAAAPISAAPAGTAATTVSASTRPAKSPAAAVATKPNLYIDFVNPISEGRLVLNIDGREAWTADLTPQHPKASDPSKPAPKPEPTRTFAHSLTVPGGAHTVNVLLLRPDGKTRETKDLDLTVEKTTPQTLRIRLSRFKRDIQLAAVTGGPTAASSAIAEKAGPELKPQAGQKKSAPQTAKK
jgi:hypothetical protein